MPTTLIIGGSGKVARALTSLLISKNHTVHSLIRNPAQSASITALGAKPIVQSIESTSTADLIATIRSCSPDVIVWSAGAGGGDPARTRAVDHEAAVRSFDAAAAAGVKRYIMVSAIDTRDRAKTAPEWYNDEDKKASDGMWNAIPVYMEAKLAADRDLRTGNEKRGLEYTIVRPGKLSENKGTGKIKAGKIHFGGDVSREDVAAVIAACMEDKGTVELAFDLLGGDTPIAEAVGKIGKDRIDTFEGYY